MDAQERAFLTDLYVATDWTERFSVLLDSNLKLPVEGRVLYVECGTGGHLLALCNRAKSKVTFLGVDESDACLELARAKALTMRAQPEFKSSPVDKLWLRDDQFECVIGDGSLVARNRLDNMFAELVRVATPGGRVALMAVSAGSFGELFSIFWEALTRLNVTDADALAERLIISLPPVSVIEDLAARADLSDIASWTSSEEFSFTSGAACFNAPLVSEFLLPVWLTGVKEVARPAVTTELANIIDAERSGADFVLTLKATVLTGVKQHAN